MAFMLLVLDKPGDARMQAAPGSRIATPAWPPAAPCWATTTCQRALDRRRPSPRRCRSYITRHAWGDTWQREGIDLRTRSIVTVAMLVALGRMHELKIHVRGALNNGVTPAEIAGDLPARQRLLRLAGGGGCLPHGRRSGRRAEKGLSHCHGGAAARWMPGRSPHGNCALPGCHVAPAISLCTRSAVVLALYLRIRRAR